MVDVESPPLACLLGFGFGIWDLGSGIGGSCGVSCGGWDEWTCEIGRGWRCVMGHS